jgi:hypothetical protein
LLFGDTAGGEHGIDDGMNAHFSQIHAAYLRKRTLALPARHTPEVEGIGLCIGHLIQRAIDGHEPQAKAKSSPRLLGGHRSTA